MGYACPVCEEPVVDAEHLADHLAFTAILRGGDHETFLDDHVPDWGERSPESLGTAVAEHADSVDLDDHDESSGADGHRRPDVQPQLHGQPADRGTGDAADRLSPDDRAVLEEARELTRRMLSPDTEDEATDGSPADSEKE